MIGHRGIRRLDAAAAACSGKKVFFFLFSLLTAPPFYLLITFRGISWSEFLHRIYIHINISKIARSIIPGICAFDINSCVLYMHAVFAPNMTLISPISLMLLMSISCTFSSLHIWTVAHRVRMRCSAISSSLALLQLMNTK